MNFLPKLFATLLLSALLPFTAAAQSKNAKVDVAEASEEIRVL